MRRAGPAAITLGTTLLLALALLRAQVAPDLGTAHRFGVGEGRVSPNGRTG
jgi:hypothetical protein